MLPPVLCLLVIAASAAEPEMKLGDWLKARFYALTAKREAAFERLNGQASLRRWQEERRDFFRQQIGDFPERTPLKARVTGRLQGEGYRIEKVMFESRPRHTVTGNLYLPDSKGPHPAILIPCGHSHNGKASGQYQRAAILFAQNGMAALCYDPVGQGERYQVIDRGVGNAYFADYPRQLAVPHPAVRHLCTTEHTLIGVGSMLLGENVAQYRVWDGMRAIDYLQSRADIRADKIGCTGNSGGGTLTAYLMALDDRIKAASPGSYLTTFEKLIEVKGPQDAEQNVFGQIAFGMGASDYLNMRAPVPILICASTRDATFPIAGARKVFEEANRFYSHLGYPERVALNEADVPHGYYLQHREAVARWMHRWLVGHDKVIWEKPRSEWPAEVTDTFLRSLSEAVWTDEQLQCSPRGQVMLMPGERSAFEINADKADQLARARKGIWRDSRDKGQIIRQAIGMKKLPLVRFETSDSRRTDNCTISRVTMHRTNRITLTAKLFVPHAKTSRSALVLSGDGMADEELPLTLVKRGYRVLSAELTGIGLTDVPANKRTWAYGRFGLDNQEILIAYLMGDSFLRMRVEDALGWSLHFHQLKLELFGTGEAAIPALHAAALAPERFGQIKLQKMIRSWTDVVRAPEHYNQLVNAVHGALRHYDLPDLVTLTRAEVVDTADVDWKP